jgi:hypothetical protein
MPLKSLHGAGDFVPFMKYNAKTGIWSARFGEDKQETRFQNPRLVFDFTNMKTGWIQFGETGPPLTQWDRVLDEEGPRPDWEKVKRGFRVLVLGLDKIKTNRGEQTLGKRELMSNSMALNGAIESMYEVWEDSLEGPGDDSLPFFEHIATEMKGSGLKESAIPIFKLVKMGPRSAFPQFDEGAVEDDAPQYASEPDQGGELGDDIPF